MSHLVTSICRHCNCLVTNGTDECGNIGWCALIAARRPDATEDEQLLADAYAAWSTRDDARRARNAAAEARS